MYLLNHEGFTVWITPMEFTFHYVSIKSTAQAAEYQSGIIFTFHYVSIKSCKVVIITTSLTNLHSTMYLLNRVKNT